MTNPQGNFNLFNVDTTSGIKIGGLLEDNNETKIKESSLLTFIDKFNKELTKLNKKIDKVNNDAKNQEEKYIDEIKIERNNIIGSLSLFVAFFTFISINITIFSKVDNLFTALILMFGMIISISIMLMIFFLFLTHKTGANIFKNQLLRLLVGLITLNIGVLYYFYNNRLRLSSSYEDRIKIIENSVKENLDLKQNLEQEISKEIELQLLRQKSKNSPN